MSDIQQFVLDAIHNTSGAYIQKCLLQRTKGHPDQVGSYFDDVIELHDLLALAAQAEEVTDKVHEIGAAFSDCRYFTINASGMMGVIPMLLLPFEAEVHLEDPKGTLGTSGGSVSAVYDGPVPELARARRSCIVIGHEEGKPWQLWTLHPGMPIPTAAVTDASLVGKTVTVREARDLGFRWVKLRAA